MSRDLVQPRAPKFVLLPPSLILQGKLLSVMDIQWFTVGDYMQLMALSGKVVIYEDFVKFLLACFNENTPDIFRADALKHIPDVISALTCVDPRVAEEMTAIFYQKNIV